MHVHVGKCIIAHLDSHPLPFAGNNRVLAVQSIVCSMSSTLLASLTMDELPKHNHSSVSIRKNAASDVTHHNHFAPSSKPTVNFTDAAIFLL
jgi:hypothetical protein